MPTLYSLLYFDYEGKIAATVWTTTVVWHQFSVILPEKVRSRSVPEAIVSDMLLLKTFHNFPEP
ncbi:hypothetical protein [Nostoc sp. NZL]|uniref:hypothetical protein n=1 Tax=Nostoc sp. NZL TaxID=2650612 RepID=UPI0018C5BEEC|nr:hypothetical protein [Nostoc sp. NZL]MBG1244529.1 hypothetical protein [Nostoc sp. NZL]